MKLNELQFNSDTGKVLLRVTIGFLMLFHGIAKLGNTGFIESLFVGMGLPSEFAYGVYLGEIIAPIMLILGIQVRIASIIITFTMLFAVFMAHANDIFTLTKHGAWAIELQMFYILTSIVVFINGNDKYSISTLCKIKK